MKTYHLTLFKKTTTFSFLGRLLLNHDLLFNRKDKNILYVAVGDENKYLVSFEAIIEDVNLFEELPEKCTAKFRYRQKDNEVNNI